MKQDPLYLIGPSARASLFTCAYHNDYLVKKVCKIDKDAVKTQLIYETLLMMSRVHYSGIAPVSIPSLLFTNQFYGCTFNCFSEPYLVVYSPIAPCSLQYYLGECYFRHQPKMNLKRCINMLYSIAYSIEYLHNSSPTIVHGIHILLLFQNIGHLCPSNILLSFKAEPQITDLFTSNFFMKATGDYIHDPYAAPELEEQPTFTTQTDIYAFGMLIADLCTGCITSAIYDKMNYQVDLNKTIEFDDILDNAYNAGLPNELITLIMNCTNQQPEVCGSVSCSMEQNRPDINSVIYSLNEFCEKNESYINCSETEVYFNIDMEGNLNVSIIDENGEYGGEEAGEDYEDYQEEQVSLLSRATRMY